MGQEALLRLGDLQIQAQIGIADTKGGARALARFGPNEVSLAPAGEMIAALAAAQETVAATLAGTGELAAGHGDTLTEDLCISRGQTHEKFAWLLKAHLG